MLEKLTHELRKIALIALFEYSLPNTDVRGKGMQHWPYLNLDKRGKSLVKQIYVNHEKELVSGFFHELEGVLQREVRSIHYKRDGISVIRGNPKYAN